MEYYLAIKNKDIMNFAGKCMDLEKIIPERRALAQKCMHAMYPLISEY
jgi:hypothetical protein